MLLFVMLDSLRHDYITRDDSPYLYRLADESLSGSVVPSFGFEPDAAYLAGLRPDEADGGAMFWLDPEHSPFRFTRFLPRGIDKLPERPAGLVRKGIRLVAQITSSNPHTRRWASPGWIPLALLPHFSFARTRRMDEPGFAPKATVFDHLREAGYAWYFHGMPEYRVSGAEVHRRFLTEFSGREKYAFLHIGDLDGVGHRYGPCSAERKAALRRLDHILEQIVTLALDRAGQVDLLIFGDHGMVQVERTLDVTPAIQRLKARGLSFDYFIDATFFRCWSQNPDILAAVRDEFNRFPGLMEIGQAQARRYGLYYRHNRFWDICWQAEAGLVFTPNFHNNHERLLGMHGYLPECLDNRSAFVLNSFRLPAHLHGRRLEAVDMRRFFQTQLALLDLPQALPLNGSLV